MATNQCFGIEIRLELVQGRGGGMCCELILPFFYNLLPLENPGDVVIIYFFIFFSFLTSLFKFMFIIFKEVRFVKCDFLKT